MFDSLAYFFYFFYYKDGQSPEKENYKGTKLNVELSPKHQPLTND